MWYCGIDNCDFPWQRASQSLKVRVNVSCFQHLEVKPPLLAGPQPPHLPQANSLLTKTPDVRGGVLKFVLKAGRFQCQGLPGTPSLLNSSSVSSPPLPQVLSQPEMYTLPVCLGMVS